MDFALHKRLVRVFSVLALVCAAGPAAGQTWYAERITTGDAPVRVEHFWSQGPMLRSETVFSGHPIVTIVAGDRYMILDRLLRTGVSIGRSPKALALDATRGRPFGNELLVMIEGGAEKVRTEEMGGRTCDLYRLTNGEGRREICVTQDEERLPLVTRVWLRASSRRAESRYLEWSREIQVSEAFFRPEPDMVIEQISYDEYVARATKEQLGPAPPFHRELLHGN